MGFSEIKQVSIFCSMVCFASRGMQRHCPPRRRPAALTRTRFAAKTGGEIMALAVDTAAGLLYRVV